MIVPACLDALASPALAPPPPDSPLPSPPRLSLPVQLCCVVTCSAAGPYGLVGTIEGVMASAAQRSLQEFLDYVHAYARQRLSQLPAAEAAVEAEVEGGWGAADAVSTQATAAAEAEQFYDAQEEGMLVEAGDRSGGLAEAEAPWGEGEASGVELLKFEEAALCYMRQLCRSGDVTARTLQELVEQVARLQQGLQALQAQQAAEAEAEAVRRRTHLWLLLGASTAAMAVVGGWRWRRGGGGTN